MFILLIIFSLIFASSYMLNYTSLLYTESFILFLAFATIFIYFSQNKSYKLNYSKDDFRWNELILFYIGLKNWNISLIRDRNVKILNFLTLVIQIKKYEILWLKKNIAKLENRDLIYLNSIVLKRLNILKQYKKLNVSTNPINYFSFT
jgi:hypothetical protein